MKMTQNRTQKIRFHVVCAVHAVVKNQIWVTCKPEISYVGYFCLQSELEIKQDDLNDCEPAVSFTETQPAPLKFTN